jgi:hypothetical protein
MQWDGLQTTARDRGWLVYAVDQGQTAPLTQPGPWGDIRAGYCLGLAATWVSLQYQGMDLSFTAQVCDYPPWQATMAQNVYQNSTTGNRLDDYQLALKPYACVLSGFKAERRHPPSASFFCQVAFQAYGCYGIIMEGSIGAHAVAMRNGRDGKMHLFDANYFHLAVQNPSQFQSAVDWWLDKSGYAKGLEKVSYIFGIKPPIHHTH